MVKQVNAVELIKDRLGIVEALSVYAGADFTRTNLNREKTSIKCPFHSDKSPSLTVYLKDQRFRCWSGCNDGKPGDAIDVVRIAYNLSTGDAIKQLRNDLQIDSGEVDQKTIIRIAEKRRELEQVKIDRETLRWTIDTLQWLHKEIPRQAKLIKTDAELQSLAPFIYVQAQIDYNLDSLLGLEDAWEWEKADIITWTKALMEGVKGIVRIGRSGREAV